MGCIIMSRGLESIFGHINDELKAAAAENQPAPAKAETKTNGKPVTIELQGDVDEYYEDLAEELDEASINVEWELSEDDTKIIVGSEDLSETTDILEYRELPYKIINQED